MFDGKLDVPIGSLVFVLGLPSMLETAVEFCVLYYFLLPIFTSFYSG
jgi:hypothetical protein